MLEPLDRRESKRKKPPKKIKRYEVKETTDFIIDLLKLSIKTVNSLDELWS